MLEHVKSTRARPRIFAPAKIRAFYYTMEHIIIMAFIISFVFYGIKYFENRILYKAPAVGPNEEEPEPPSMKPVFRDSVLIFICSVGCMFFVEQVTPAVMTMIGGFSTGEILDSSTPAVFTGQPGF